MQLRNSCRPNGDFSRSRRLVQHFFAAHTIWSVCCCRTGSHAQYFKIKHNFHIALNFRFVDAFFRCCGAICRTTNFSNFSLHLRPIQSLLLSNSCISREEFPQHSAIKQKIVRWKWICLNHRIAFITFAKYYCYWV